MNQVNLLGRLSKDVDYRTGNTNIARFTLAVNRKFKRDEADFINCIAFGKTADIINQYLSKGSQIAISGNIRTGSYEAQDGTRRYTTDIVVENFDFISSNNKQENKVNEFEEEMNRVEDGYVPF
ncbi:single-stranded DNA-binding protein [Clostridium phage CPQ4]|nr:single-stranded DNA-binding protein [Clostridium phage CPQ4]